MHHGATVARIREVPSYLALIFIATSAVCIMTADLKQALITLVTGACGYMAAMWLHRLQQQYLQLSSSNTKCEEASAENDKDDCASMAKLQLAERRDRMSGTLIRMIDYISKEVELDSIVERVMEAAYTLVPADR